MKNVILNLKKKHLLPSKKIQTKKSQTSSSLSLSLETLSSSSFNWLLYHFSSCNNNGNNENRMIALRLRRLWGANRTENSGSNLNYYRPKAHRTQKLFQNFKTGSASYSFINILMSKMSLKSCKSALEVYLEKFIFWAQFTIFA